jgi:hypothetical protein
MVAVTLNLIPGDENTVETKTFCGVVGGKDNLALNVSERSVSDNVAGTGQLAKFEKRFAPRAALMLSYEFEMVAASYA